MENKKLINLFSQLIDRQYPKHKGKFTNSDVALNILRHDFDKLIREINVVGLDKCYELRKPEDA